MKKEADTDEKKAWQALAQVEDPDLKKDLVTLGMIKDLQVKPQHVSFRLVLTTPACPLRELLRKRCEEALQAALGKDTQIDIRFDAQVTSAHNKKNTLPGIKNVVGVASGKGGVGKSTVAANLAVVLAEEGAAVGLLDADIFGPSVPTLFACRAEKPKIFKKEGRNCLVPLEQYGIKLMSIGFLVAEEQAVMWRGPMASTALKQLLGDTEWGELDYLLVDLPPGTSDIPITLAQHFPLTGMLMVSTPQQVALADVHKSISMCKQPQISLPLLGMVENMAYFVTDAESQKRHYLFGKGGAETLAQQEKIPFLGKIPIYERLREGGDRGYPAALRAGPWREDFFALAGKLAQQIALHNAQSQPTAPPVSATP